MASGADKPQPLGAILPGVLKTFRRRTDLDLMRVWDVWEEAVGAGIAANCRPGSFRGGMLIVYVSSSPWMQQLRFLRPEMIARLNAALGGERITEIRFRIDPR